MALLKAEKTLRNTVNTLYELFCARVCASVRECARVCASVRECARVCASVRECARVCASVRVWVCNPSSVRTDFDDNTSKCVRTLRQCME